MNRYLADRASRRRGRGRGRDYRRGRDYGYDMAMDSGYSYTERDSRYDSRYGSDYRGQDYHYGGQRYGEYRRPMDYEIYGVGGIHPIQDYRRGRDGHMEDAEKEYREDLREWCKKLKKHDRFNMHKEDIIQQARQMGIKFDKFDEEEFLCTYYMMMSDYKMEMLNSPQAFMVMAKDFLEDDDAERQGSEKLCTYYYEIVKGGEE